MQLTRSGNKLNPTKGVAINNGQKVAQKQFEVQLRSTLFSTNTIEIKCCSFEINLVKKNWGRNISEAPEGGS